MPEIVEIRMMSEFINEQATGHYFIKMKKSAVSKNKLPFDTERKFKIKSWFRGKEMMLDIKENDKPIRKIILTMGMSGNWGLSKEIPKHAHLIFEREDGMFLYLVDPRRFAKWKEGSWSINRGPDPVKEHETFKKNILNNLDKPIFQLPIYEIMLNQKYFNGIGNYLRSTILYYLDVNPFDSGKNIISKNKNKFFELCKQIPIKAYELGGGQLMSWKNPLIVENDEFLKWVFYKNGIKIIDSNGRTFWCNNKFLSKSRILPKS